MTPNNSEDAANRAAASRQHWIRRKLDLDIFEMILGAQRHQDAQGYCHLLDGKRFPAAIFKGINVDERTWAAFSAAPMFSTSLDQVASIEAILKDKGLARLYVEELAERLYLHQGVITPDRTFTLLTASPTDRAAAVLLAWHRARDEGRI